MALRPGIKRFDSIRNVLIPDYSFDSDLEVKVINWHSDVDSDTTVLRNYESELNSILLVTAESLLNASGTSAAIDSEAKRVWAHYYEVQKLLDSEYIRNRDELQYVIGRLDSESMSVQAAKTHLENMLDSEYIKNRQWFAYAQQRMDSDELALQHAKTHLENLLDSEYVKNRQWFAYAEGRLDSDELEIQALKTKLENLLDSEYAKNREMLTYLESRLDSDELAIQTNLNTLQNLLDSEYAKSREWYAYAEGRLDSDEAFLQYISTNYVKTVNGIQPDISNNVILSVVGVRTGTEDQKRDAIGSDIAGEGDVWVVSGDSDSQNDGRAYIFDSDANVWRTISGFDVAQSDARYVNTSGDTMTGGLTVPSLQVNAGTITSVSPTVTLSGAVTGSGTLTNLGNVTIATTHTADPTLTVTGAVTGSTTFTNLGNATLNTSASPQLTLSGDVTGTATFTNLANATLTTTVVESNVDHDLLSNFVANEHIDHTTVSVTAGNGLTGGGTIAATRTIAVQAANSSITVGASGISVSEGNVNHDSLNGFVANEHVDHSTVSVIAGAGLTGGGTIASSRTLNVVGTNGITVNADDITLSGSYTGNFTVTGTVFASVDVTVTSDARLKTNVETIDGTKAFEMRGVHYDIDGRRTSGVIAQEIEKIAPELVHENDEGFKSVAYGPVVAYLIEAVKQLNERVKELESK